MSVSTSSTTPGTGTACPAGPAPAGGERARLIDELRTALIEVLGAERRLRGREHSGPHAVALTAAQLWALSVLRDGERTAGEIADRTVTNPATITAMLDNLEGQGFVERRRSTKDRRVCLVSLTDRGHEVVEQKRRRYQRLWREKLAGAEDRELEAAIGVMRLIVETLDAS